MTWLRNRPIIALLLVALVQTGVLGAMVLDRVRLIKTGREITLPIIPVDPRDVFRGEYVRLGYEVGTVPAQLLDGPAPRRNRAFYVVLEKGEGGAWKPVKVSRAMPLETGADRIVLKARSRWDWPARTTEQKVNVRYGIESYFVPEGEGRRLEQLARAKKMAALVAVDSRGNAAIKGLIIDGELRYEEPLL
jgi:uncharacterized membrane-anchored protein